MSAFEGFYKKEYINAGIILDANRKVEIKNAFKAGLEAAAQEVERLKRGYGSERHDESCTLAIETIRALKEDK